MLAGEGVACVLGFGWAIAVVFSAIFEFLTAGVISGVGVFGVVGLGSSITVALPLVTLVLATGGSAVELFLPNHLVRLTTIINPIIPTRIAAMLIINRDLMGRLVNGSLCSASGLWAISEGTSIIGDSGDGIVSAGFRAEANLLVGGGSELLEIGMGCGILGSYGADRIEPSTKQKDKVSSA